MPEPPVHALTQSEFRISRIFSRAWKLLTANLWTFFTVTIVSELPVRVYFHWGNAAGELLVGTTMRTIIIVLGVVLVLFGQAVIVHIGFRILREQPASLHEALQQAWVSLFSILALALVVYLLIFGPLPLLISPLFAMVFMVGTGMLFVRWSLALPACVVEGLGLVDSLQRSARLSRGHRWKIFGMIILICGPLPVAMTILTAAMSLLGSAFQYLGQYVLGVAWITGFTSVLVVIYHDLRVANDGIDSGQIASVFD
jgi:Membrane domain of glycerophosphoryl diester phosphodiesterase